MTGTGRVAADLEARLRRRWDRPDLVVASVEPFGDGHSGFTYLVQVGPPGRPAPAVLRLAPPGTRPRGPADVGRQGRVMAALGAAGLPVPAVLDHDSGPAVDGRSFALTELVDGVPWEVAAAASSHREVAAAAVDVLHRLHALDPAATGLGGEDRSGPVDELARWAALLARAPAWLADPGAELHGRLAATAPAAPPARLVHGDFHYGNLLYARTDPGAAPRVAAVVDWEIAELGPPLLDLGALALASRRRWYRGTDPNPTGDVAVTTAELVDLYGADPGEAAWYLALTCFKYAAILGHNLALHRSGRRPDPVYEELVATMAALVVDGTAVLDRGLDEPGGAGAPVPARGPTHEG